MSSHIRDGKCAVRPYVYTDTQTLEMIKTALGGKITGQFETPIGHHVEIEIEDSMLILEVSDNFPESMGKPDGSIYIYVKDVDAVYAQALGFGCESISAPEDKPYDERQAGVRDSSGNVWWLSRYLAP